MTITLTASEQDAHVRYIPNRDLLPGHVIWFFGVEHRIDHFRAEQRGPLFDPERHPQRRVAVAADGWTMTLSEDPEQLVPVIAPTDTYRVDVYQARTPHEPAEAVAFVAETEARAVITARRILVLSEAAWGDVHAGDRYLDTVAVA